MWISAETNSVTDLSFIFADLLLLQWSSSHNNHIFNEAPPTTTTPLVKLLPQKKNHSFSEAPPTKKNSFDEAPPTTITASVKLLPMQFSNKCWNISISLQVKTSIRASVRSEICRDRVYWRTERSRTLQNETHWRTNRLCLFLIL